MPKSTPVLRRRYGDPFHGRFGRRTACLQDHEGLNRLAPALLAVALLLALAAPVSCSIAGRSLSLDVYSDGYVLVTRTVSVDPSATSVQVPLLSSVVSNLVATDQSGSPLSYGLSSAGTNITVYTLGASSVTLRYDTSNLTSKSGTVWTLAFAARFNSTVVLPEFSTLLSVSGTPYSINETGTSPEVSLSPGAWKVTYGVPLGTTASGGRGGRPLLAPAQVGALAIAMAALAGGLYYRRWRGGRPGPTSGELRPDDVQVLRFIHERGGKALELEIRSKFALPKTSAWRQIKRLESMGYVKVTKAGSQNQIEILKNWSGAV